MTENGVSPDKLVSVLHYDGSPITARFIARHRRVIRPAQRLDPRKRRRDFLPSRNSAIPLIEKNELGFTHRDYEGSCRRCARAADMIDFVRHHARLLRARPCRRTRWPSSPGIGCSSKTPTYFLGNAHGFNSVHGRMPSVLTGANLANKDLIYLGVSGDGDSASIGFGQFAHAIRRGVNMVYIVANNGVYGLTKGHSRPPPTRARR